MTRIEQMDFLIKWLTRENLQYQGMEAPANEQEKWNLLRSLMNVRQPGPADEQFLQVQDALLTELTGSKGIVDVDDLPTIPGETKLT